MTDDFWTRLSERMLAGDSAAAEEIVREYEPYLRMVVRRRLSPRARTRFDSRDVVQSVWAETLQKIQEGRAGWRFPDETRLRSFLVRLTRNRLIDFYRRHRASLAAEQPLSPRDERRLAAPRGDQPSGHAQADELWLLLLSSCPPAYRELLRLKAQGVPLAEIADRTGLHKGSVRRILYDLADRLAAHAPDLLPARAT